MRKYLIGLVTGVLLTLPIGIFANDISSIGKRIDSEFVVKLDGEELPVKAIGIDGTSYAPLRATGEALGLNVDFVDRTVILESKKEGDSLIEETTFNGLKAVVLDEEIYFSGKEYHDKFRELSFGLSYDSEKKSFSYVEFESPTSNQVKKKHFEFNQDDPGVIYIHDGASYINIKYYREPLDFE